MPVILYRCLTNVTGVRSGRTIIEGTRIGVHDVVGLVVNGAGIDDVCRTFPSVSRAQVYECLAYYEDHRAEIDDLVAGQMQRSTDVTFLLDQDVPDDVARWLRHCGRKKGELRRPITTEVSHAIHTSKRRTRCPRTRCPPRGSS